MDKNQDLIAFLEKLAALAAEERALHPQLAQFTKGLAVAKGITCAKQLLDQLKEAA